MSFKIFSGSDCQLAERVASLLNKKLGEIELKRFSDNEIYVRIGENVRGIDTFVVQSTDSLTLPDRLLELLLIIDALKRASAKSIAAVIPYFGYSRQDKKDRSGEPISVSLISELLEAAGATRVVTIDIHSPQIQGMFNFPVDNLTAILILSSYFEKYNSEPLVVVSPDVGGVKRARMFAKRLNAPLAIIDKRRPAPNKAKVMHVIGDVDKKVAVIVDDMIDTGGTVSEAANALTKNGAKKVFVCATHGLFSGPALKRIENSALEKVVVTDTISPKRKNKKIAYLSVAPLLAEAIKRTVNNQSLAPLFERLPERYKFL